MSKLRGALIVLEGCDRSGKTTQCKKLVDVLKADGRDVAFMNFPNRSTECGALINAFLTNQQDFDHETIHLLFTMNRWEGKKNMERMLKAGTTIIVDRYSYSGVAYSAAKGLSLEWCKAPESNLLKPDLVMYLTLSPEAMAKRGGFGDERYEIPEMQQKVHKYFEKLYDPQYWQQINADQSMEQLNSTLKAIVERTIDASAGRPLSLLW